MPLASLRSTRRVLRLAGGDVLPFLQGLTTNDVLSLSETTTPALYSALLSPQGRILSDVFFHWERGRSGEGEASTSSTSSSTSTSTSSSSQSSSSSPPSLFAEVDASVAPQVLSLLRRYRLRAQVDIDDVGDEFEVAVKGFGGGSGEVEDEGGEKEKEEKEEWPRDPRGLRALGFRTVLPSASLSASSSASASSSSYAAARYALGVAEGAELEPGRGTPLEANLDGLRGVSFTKGCYVGQELVARAHFRGQVHKRVMPVKVLVGGGDGGGGNGGEKGGPIGRDLVVAVAPENEKASSSSSASSSSPPPRPARRSAGRLLALCRESGLGLALLRLNSVQGLLLPGGGGEAAPELALAPSEEESGSEIGSGSGFLFSASRPEWWPEDWGRE